MRQLPSDLSSKINQSLQTIGNNANPKMSIQVSRAKDTVMDSSYWTVETIRTKEGLGDLSIAAQRLNSFKNPTRLYNIYVDNGVVKTAIREYPDTKKEKWKPQFDLGAGNAVAIAFDGEWEFYRKRWQLRTYEKPFIFWVDTGALWTQSWDEVGTLFQLSGDVTKVKAIRGWKNPIFIDKDQGIVAGYIKTDGKVYYRGWARQIDGSTIWEIEKQVLEFTGTAVNLNMFITNDYRMGFIIEDNLGNITTYLTTRNWAGMAIAPEYIQARIGGTIEMIWIEKFNAYNTEYISASVGGDLSLLWGTSYNGFRTVENFAITMLDEFGQEYQNYGFRIRFITEHDMAVLDYADFTLINEMAKSFAITGITKTGYKEYELTTADFNNTFGNLTLTFLGSGNTKGEAEQDIASFDVTFSPTNLVPTFIPLPEVEVTWNE